MRIFSLALCCGLSLASMIGCASRSAMLPTNARVITPVAAGNVMDEMRVMSFNLRVPFVLDFANYWSHRKSLVVQTIRQFQPDVLATQECVQSQAKYLLKHLPEYRFVGAGRNNGKTAGEMAGIFYRADRFTLKDSGHFWLSNTPEKAGSQSWGSMWPRMVTWVKLQPLKPGSQPFYHFNTHFSVASENARIQSARLLRSRIASIAGNAAFMVSGDFNADDNTSVYHTLVNGTQKHDVKLVDTYRKLYPVDRQHEGTRGGFSGDTDGPRIDWILTSPGIETLAAGINRTNADGRFPSDHFPIVAVVRMSSPTMLVAKRTPAPSSRVAAANAAATRQGVNATTVTP